MDQVEFEFPDEKEAKGKPTEAKQEDDFSFEVEDDTPEEDRNRQPLPREIVQELEQDELEDYSEKVKTRLKQMKKVWHDERREKEQALREQQEALNYAQRIIAENQALKSRLSEGEKSYLDTYKSAAELELNVAERAYKTAYEEGDSEKLLEAQRKIAEANYKLQKAKDYVPTLQDDSDSVKVAPQAQVPRPDPRLTAWQERNTWFGQDEEMTSLALGLHQKLVKQYGEAYPSTDEYWRKIDETMTLRFPEYFQSSPQRGEKPVTRTEKPATVVAPASRSTSSKKIVLKQSELAIAKKLGITPEQYAREKLLLNGGQ